MHKARFISFIGAACLMAGTAGAADADFRHGFSKVAKQATPAVVFIQVEKDVPAGAVYEFFNDPSELFGEGGLLDRFRRGRAPNGARLPMFRQTGQGSGFLISKDGYILTNTHVVGDVDKITVKLADGREFTAKRIGADSKTEVALIKIEGNDFPYLPAGDPAKLETGDWVVAIGNPFGLKETLTVGVVSAKGRNNIGITDYEDFIQTDAAINPGNSGGPLLNIDGEVIGINTAIYSRSGGYMGIGFAVPIDMAMQIKDQLVQHGKVTRGYLGVVLNDDLTADMAKMFGRSEKGGVLIADVIPGGPAAEAGIKSGDIITALDGSAVENNAGFRRAIANRSPKSKIKLTLFRDGKEKTLAATVAPFPDDGAISAAGPDASPAESIGIEVQDLTEDLAQRFGFEMEKGAVITDVRDGSAAAEADLEPGMLILEVNRHDVDSAESLAREIRRAPKGNLLLRIKTAKRTLFVTLKK